jgi:hypothetical protein
LDAFPLGDNLQIFGFASLNDRYKADRRLCLKYEEFKAVHIKEQAEKAEAKLIEVLKVGARKLSKHPTSPSKLNSFIFIFPVSFQEAAVVNKLIDFRDPLRPFVDTILEKSPRATSIAVPNTDLEAADITEKTLVALHKKVILAQRESDRCERFVIFYIIFFFWLVH